MLERCIRPPVRGFGPSRFAAKGIVESAFRGFDSPSVHHTRKRCEGALA